MRMRVKGVLKIEVPVDMEFETCSMDCEVRLEDAKKQCLDNIFFVANDPQCAKLEGAYFLPPMSRISSGVAMA